MQRIFDTFQEAEAFLGPDFTRVGTDTAEEVFDYIDWDRNAVRISRCADGWLFASEDADGFMDEVEA